MKNGYKKLTAMVLVAAMAASTVGVSAATNQERLNNINQQISSAKIQMDSAQKKANSLTQKIGSLDKQINTTQSSINKIQGDINNTLSQIEIKKQELDVKSQQIAKQNTDLGNRLCAMYKNGEISYMEIILGSGSFSEFLNNIDMIVKIYKQDEEFMKLLQQQYDALAETKKELEELNSKLETQRNQLQSKQAALQSDRTEAAQLREQAEADIEAQNELIDGLNESAQQIVTLIQEEQRKAEEAAAAAAAKKAAEEAAAAAAAAQKAASNTTSSSSKSSSSSSYSSSSRPVYSTGSTTSSQAASFNGSFALPAPSYVRISSYYGYRIHPITGTRKMHTGIDFAAPQGSPCVASAAGTVIFSGWYSGYGYTVVIDHGDGISTLYGHNSSLLVSKGQSVSKGQQIAKIGSTGNSTGPHCHFEVRINGQYTNPMPYLNGSK